MQRLSESGNWNLDVVQTLVRAVLKIGGGYLLAKGLADESTLEAFIAGAVALVAIVWGVRHRTTSRGSTSPGSLRSAPLLFLFFALLVCGCASFTTRAFREEKAATDAAYGSLREWKGYFASAVTNAPPAERAALTNLNTQIYGASRAFAEVMAATEGLRQVWVTNGAATNRAMLEAALAMARTG